MPSRSTEEVFADHLQLALTGDLETNLERSFADDTVFLTSFGIYHGREGACELAKLLAHQVPGSNHIRDGRIRAMTIYYRVLANLES